MYIFLIDVPGKYFMCPFEEFENPRKSGKLWTEVTKSYDKYEVFVFYSRESTKKWSRTRYADFQGSKYYEWVRFFTDQWFVLANLAPITVTIQTDQTGDLLNVHNFFKNFVLDTIQTTYCSKSGSALDPEKVRKSYKHTRPVFGIRNQRFEKRYKVPAVCHCHRQCQLLFVSKRDDPGRTRCRR
jgi:hypothetical protein